VLDVACGTGILARTAADAVGPQGSVVGVDINPAMLAVAERVRPDIDWRRADVQRLPFPDACFDRVVCQMALMFFADRTAAAAEMARVVRPGGTVAVMAPASLPEQPAWGPFVAAAARHAGPDAVRLLGTYWSAGDIDELAGLLRGAGLEDVGATTRIGVATFPSLDEMITTEVESTPLASRIERDVYDMIRNDARAALARFVAADGRALLPLTGRLVSGRRPADDR
jgi:SAM-dependent methyltransferase